MIVAHGQPSDPGPAEARLAALAARVASFLPGWRVHSATLAAPGSLEQALSACLSAPRVYPLFMADGWFTQQTLPARLGMSAEHILPPLGLDPALPAIATTMLFDAAAARHWRIAETHVLVAAHGSAKNANPARCAERFSRALATRAPFAGVHCGFIEQAPGLAEVASGCPTRTLCLPFFARDGGHVREDVPEALADAEFRGEVLEAIGESALVPSLIARALRDTTTREVAA